MKLKWCMAIALAFTACVEAEPLIERAPDAHIDTPEEWCEGDGCELPIEPKLDAQEADDAPDTHRTSPSISTPPETVLKAGDPTAPEAPFEPSTPTFPDTRPAHIARPEMIGEPTLLAAHSEYNCAVIDDAVTCWGDNRDGQAMPPANTRADHLALARDFACAASATHGIVCWGDGSWRVRAIIDEHAISSHHTISAFDASWLGVLCYNAANGPDGQIICGNDQATWTVGTSNGFGASIGYIQAPALTPIVCHIETNHAAFAGEPGYSYHCAIADRSWEIPAPNVDAPRSVTPQIEVGAGGTSVTILDQAGMAHWYEISLETARREIELDFSPIAIDASNIYEADLSYKRLVTPHCGWTGTVVLCRDQEDTLQYAFRAYGPLISAHQDGNGISRCYTERGYDHNGQPLPLWISCAHIYWRYP